MDERAATVKKRASEKSTGCRMRREEHAISFQRWDRRARLLAISTAALAGLGGIGAISSAKAGGTLAIFAGSLVVVTVLVRAIDEGLGAAKTAEDHRLAALRFRGGQIDYLTLSQFPPDDGKTAEEKLIQIQAKAMQAETSSPLVERKSKLEREQLEHEDS